MGQIPGSSCTQPEEDIFLHQMRVYRWRADTNVNTYLPRIHFKNALVQLQQQKFAKFLEQPENKQYFQVSKFKQELQEIPRTGDDQVIIFQKYQCSLAQLRNRMTLQQSLYALQSLLTGYQQIKKVYQRITVDASCCFITGQGSIRAWINPNVKINRVWKYHEAESLRHKIIQRIVKMVEECTQVSKLSQLFFRNLYYKFANQHFNHCSYSELRRSINQFCYVQKVHMAKNISLQAKQQEQTKIRGSKCYQRHSRKSEAQSHEFWKENNPLFLSTQQSQVYRPFQKVRSLQKDIRMAPALFQPRNINIAYSPIRQIKNQDNNHLQQSASQVFTANKGQPLPMKCSSLIQAAAHSNIPIQSFFQPSHIKTGLQQMKESQISVKRSKNSYLSRQGQSFESKNIAHRETEVVFNKPSIKRETTTIQKFKEESNHKKIMHASIMQNINEVKSFRKQNRYRTFADKQLSQRQSNSDSVYQRPWITTKTITRLISDNQDKYSLKNSIGQSSDYFYGSAYSGVLTQMGREVAKPVNEVRSKTLGVVGQQL